MKKLFLIALLAVAFQLSAQPLWMRHNVISPQGDKIAFCYKGDVYVVNAQGGKALQITTNAAYDGDPIWSPDGKQIAFSTAFSRNKIHVKVTVSVGGKGNLFAVR